MAGKLSNLIKVVMPKGRGGSKPTAQTNTFNPSQTDQILPIPAYRDHLEDLATARVTYDSRELLKRLFKNDPDISAAVNAYLTVADTDPTFYVRDLNGEFDVDGHKTVTQIIQSLTTRTDYSKGYRHVQGLRAICERLRYMILLRGGIGAELVLSKLALPDQINIIDMSTVEWKEQAAGIYSPLQRPKSGGNPIDLSKLQTFFTAFYRQDPTEIYATSVFVSAINTIVARQQVINDLYRIMQTTGFPRVSLKIVEEVLVKNAPADVKANPQKLRQFVTERLQEVSNAWGNIRVDQAFAHTDSIEASILNEKNPSMGLDIKPVIDVLNAQNQAALKVMATVIGRGESGVNTASVEARIFSLNADQLNVPVAELLSQIFTYCLRLLGSESSVEVRFREAELRSKSELEPQMTLKAARLKEDLSLGIIDDIEYHMEMYGRPPPAGAPKLSGTGFMQASNASAVSDKTTPNSDPLGRSQTGEGGKAAKDMTKSNAVKK